jgi:hypothetical protein
LANGIGGGGQPEINLFHNDPLSPGYHPGLCAIIDFPNGNRITSGSCTF